MKIHNISTFFLPKLKDFPSKLQDFFLNSSIWEIHLLAKWKKSVRKKACSRVHGGLNSSRCQHLKNSLNPTHKPFILLSLQSMRVNWFAPKYVLFPEEEHTEKLRLWPGYPQTHRGLSSGTLAQYGRRRTPRSPSGRKWLHGQHHYPNKIWNARMNPNATQAFSKTFLFDFLY